LNELQERLGEESFFRSHRSYLVNLRKVKEIIPWFNGAYNIILEDLPNEEIPVSRQQAGPLKRIFGL
jgi:two-component system LytT family response regulator/two-component system response regulator LytT